MIFIYLTLVIPICFLLTKEIYKIINCIFLTQKFTYIVKTESSIDDNDIFNLAEVYINRKLWLSCILLLEKYINLYSKSKEEFYSCIGFCYLSTGFCRISEENYEQALKTNNNNISYLNQLIKIYSYNPSRNKTKLEKTYKKIQEIEKSLTNSRNINRDSRI